MQSQSSLKSENFLALLIRLGKEGNVRMLERLSFMDCLSSSTLTAIVKTVVETECFRCSPILYKMFPWIPGGILCLPQLKRLA